MRRARLLRSMAELQIFLLVIGVRERSDLRVRKIATTLEVAGGLSGGHGLLS